MKPPSNFGIQVKQELTGSILSNRARTAALTFNCQLDTLDFILYSLLFLLLQSRRPESLISFVGIRTVSKPDASTAEEAKKRNQFPSRRNSSTKQN